MKFEFYHFLSFLAADCESPFSKRCIYSNPAFKGEGREEDNLAKIWHTFWKLWTSTPQPFTGPWIAALSHGKTGVQTQASQFAATCLRSALFLVLLAASHGAALTDPRWSWDPNRTADSQTLDTTSEIHNVMRPSGKSCVCKVGKAIL